MRKIANTTELQTELRKILAYAQSELPSRTTIAHQLEQLSLRVAKEELKEVNVIVEKGRGYDDAPSWLVWTQEGNNRRLYQGEYEIPKGTSDRKEVLRKLEIYGFKPTKIVDRDGWRDLTHKDKW